MDGKWEIDFYRDRDEEAFLDAYEEKYGPLSDEEWTTVYEEIGQEIDRQVKEGIHELGDSFTYRDVLVGYSDLNEGYSLYLFSMDK